MYTILQYRGAYDSFVASLEDKKLRAAVDQRLSRLAALGRNAGPKVSAPLRDGIFECRAQRNRQQARILWFYVKNMRIIVTAGVIKERKVPPDLIDAAIDIKKTLEEHPELLNDLTEIH